MTSLRDVNRFLVRIPAEPDPAGPILRAVPLRGTTGAVVALAGEIDISSAEQARSAVNECLRAPPPAALSIDVSALTFCDSAGIWALEWAHREAQAGHLPFRLFGATARLRRVFTLAHADDLLTACEPVPNGRSVQANQGLRQSVGIPWTCHPVAGVSSANLSRGWRIGRCPYGLTVILVGHVVVS